MHCICTNDNVKPIEPSSVLLPYAVLGQHSLSPSQPFPSFQRDVSLTGWQHSAATPGVTCVSVGSPTVYMTPSSTFSTCFVLSGKCFANGMTFLGNVSRTAWQHCDPCFSHWQLYVACSMVGNHTNIYIPAPEGKTKNFSDIPNRR